MQTLVLARRQALDAAVTAFRLVSRPALGTINCWWMSISSGICITSEEDTVMSARFAVRLILVSAAEPST